MTDAPNTPAARSGSLAIACAVVLGVLACFLGKAFTIDGALFLKLARHLTREPFDFFGFVVNWYATDMPMHAVTRNPPFMGHYLALAGSLFGWSELALHTAALLPAAAACSGTWLLARRLCARPLEATLIGLLTPVFLVSSTSVMCDTAMLGFWCWSLWCWIKGFDEERVGFLVGGALLAGFAALTKYYGVALLPLLLAYGFLRRGRPGRWLLALLVPIALLGAYQWWTHVSYGRGLLFDAARYAVSKRERMQDPELGPHSVTALVVGLLFAGGCLVPALFYAPLVHGRRIAVGLGVLAAAACAWMLARGSLPGVDVSAIETPTWLLALQLGLLLAAGASLLVLPLTDLARSRTPESWLLLLWLFGTFAFAAFVNWANNGRSNLPLAPVLGILVARALDARGERGRAVGAAARAAAFAPGVVLALIVTWADAHWAGEVRRAARDIGARYAADSRLWFLGHWGFQHYIEESGALPVDVFRTDLRRGELLVLPRNNTDLYSAPQGAVRVLERIERPEPRWIRTVAASVGAGFYASDRGPLPWAFGPAVPDAYLVGRVVREFRFKTPPR